MHWLHERALETLQKSLMQQIEKIPEKRGTRKALALLNLFIYLGLVESLGISLVDMLCILLVANGRDFHVERVYDVPRIVHVASFKDLDSKNVTLGVKLGFLERNGLKEISKFIDRPLRTAIAHLKFHIDDEGKISIRPKTVNIYDKISTFKLYFITITMYLTEVSRI